MSEDPYRAELSAALARNERLEAELAEAKRQLAELPEARAKKTKLNELREAAEKRWAEAKDTQRAVTRWIGGLSLVGTIVFVLAIASMGSSGHPLAAGIVGTIIGLSVTIMAHLLFGIPAERRLLELVALNRKTTTPIRVEVADESPKFRVENAIDAATDDAMAVDESDMAAHAKQR